MSESVCIRRQRTLGLDPALAESVALIVAAAVVEFVAVTWRPGYASRPQEPTYDSRHRDPRRVGTPARTKSDAKSMRESARASGMAHASELLPGFVASDGDLVQ